MIPLVYKIGIILGGGLNWFFLKSTKILQISSIINIVPLVLENEISRFRNHIRGWTNMGKFSRTHNNHLKSVQLSAIASFGVRNKIG